VKKNSSDIDQGLFNEKGRVVKVQLLYDRQDRSEGVAFITYDDVEDAKDAIADFNGANAYGQPIRITLLPAAKPRNPFDTAEAPRRSLFDRIEQPAPRRRRARSDSPVRRRHSDVSKPAPENIDRYVPGEDSGRERERERERRRSPRRRTELRGGRGSRRPGDRRGGRGLQRDPEGHPLVQGRPRKTVNELDAEMDDYWRKGETEDNGTANGAQAAPASHNDDDIDMIE
jgi:THO complex subunit 4